MNLQEIISSLENNEMPLQEIITELRKFKNGKSSSLWRCIHHKDEVISQTNITYEEIADIGTPICSECGEDMEYVSEEWESKND